MPPADLRCLICLRTSADRAASLLFMRRIASKASVSQPVVADVPDGPVLSVGSAAFVAAEGLFTTRSHVFEGKRIVILKWMPFRHLMPVPDGSQALVGKRLPEGCEPRVCNVFQPLVAPWSRSSPT